MRWTWVMAAAAGLLGACAADSVPVVLSFPSEDAFVRAETVEVYAVDISDKDAGLCPEFISRAEVAALDSIAHQTGQATLCDFRDGVVELVEVSEGLKAYVGIARGAGQPLLSGCTVRDVYRESGPLTVVLSPTDAYRSMYPAGTDREACTPAQKCEGGCP